ncbi:MAG: nucleotidyltransferase [Rickettsia endosymbiont of Haemaphysalis japonica]
MKDIAKDYYEYWFGRGKGFLKGATTYLNDLEYVLSAFALHQATAILILLVFSNYKPKLHNLQELGSMAGNYDNESWSVFLQ